VVRLYFRHARTLNRQLLRYMEQRPVTTLSSPAPEERHAGRKDGSWKWKNFAVRDGLAGIDQRDRRSPTGSVYALPRRIFALGVPVSRTRARHRLHHVASGVAAQEYAHHLAG